MSIIAESSELMLAKGDPLQGIVDASFVVSSQYDLLSKGFTHIEGWNCIKHEPYTDQPEEGHFDWGGLACNVLAGLAVVGAVALTLFTFGAAAPVIIGAIAVGSMAVVSQGISDYMSGNVSDTASYVRAGFLGAVAGAVSGGVSALIEGAIPAGATLLVKMGITGASGVVETLIENTIMGQKTTWQELCFAFGMSAAMFGIGDEVGRAFKKARSGASQTDNVVRAVTGQADDLLEGAAKQADDILESVAKQTDDLLEDTAKHADDILGEATEHVDDMLDDMPRYTEGALDNAPRYTGEVSEGWTDNVGFRQAADEADNAGRTVAGQTDDVANHVDDTFKGTGGEKYTKTSYTGKTKVGGEARDISRNVYQRNDIDWDRIDPATGLSNREIALNGGAPCWNDGTKVELHHLLQEEPGPMVEIPASMHDEYYKTLHGLVGDGGSFRNNPILEKQYNNFRSKYWRWRAKNL